MENQQHLEIAEILKSLGTAISLLKAETLEEEEFFSGSLDFKYMNFWSSDVETIARNFSLRRSPQCVPLTILNFNFNDLLGDEGAIALAENMPRSLRELELVGCGIGDLGARAILDWIRQSRNIQIVSIEGNNFSQSMKDELKEFGENNRRVLVVY